MHTEAPLLSQSPYKCKWLARARTQCVLLSLHCWHTNHVAISWPHNSCWVFIYLLWGDQGATGWFLQDRFWSLQQFGVWNIHSPVGFICNVIFSTFSLLLITFTHEETFTHRSKLNVMIMKRFPPWVAACLYLFGLSVNFVLACYQFQPPQNLYARLCFIKIDRWEQLVRIWFYFGCIITEHISHQVRPAATAASMERRGGAGDTGWRRLIQRYCSAQGKVADGELGLWPPLLFSLLNPGQPRPQGAPIFCQRVSTLASLLSEFWLHLNAKEILWCKLSQWKVLSPKDASRVKADKDAVWAVNTRRNACLQLKQQVAYLDIIASTKTFVYFYCSFRLVSTRCKHAGVSAAERLTRWAKAWLGSSWVRLQLWAILGKISLHGHRAGACKSIPSFCRSTSARRRQRATGVGGQSSVLVTCGGSATP